MTPEPSNEYQKLVEAENAWHLVSESKPPLHMQVLVELKEGVGQVCDVACYVGRQDDGEDRWLLADVRLDSRQIKRWAHIYPVPPKSEIDAAVKAALSALKLPHAGDDGWQDIATAPKDGTPFLAYNPMIGVYNTAFTTRWTGDPDETGYEGFPCGFWHLGGSRSYPFGKWDCVPTHWRPLPTPPAGVSDNV